MAKKITQAETIRRYITTHPELPIAQVAKDLGVKYQAVWATKRAVSRKLEKLGAKVGDTVGGLTLTKTNGKYRWKRVATVSSNTPLPITMEEPKAANKTQNQGELRTVMRMTINDKSDPVYHPAHYKVGGIETIDFIEAKDLNYRLGNVVKYVSRAGKKSSDPVQDLEKAMFYLKREIDARKSA